MFRNITDTNIPVVILWGAPNVGKTFTLLRLLKYLRNQGYYFQINESYQTYLNSEFKDVCHAFEETLSTLMYSYSPCINLNFGGTLHKISIFARSICQIIDESGELYFGSQNIFLTDYLLGHSVKRIWVIIIDLNCSEMNNDYDIHYANQIDRIREKSNDSDKLILLVNKIDQTPYMISPIDFRMNALKNEIEAKFPLLYESLKEKNSFKKLFCSLKCVILPYTSGDFLKTFDDHGCEYQRWCFGEDIFPQKLIKEILK